MSQQIAAIRSLFASTHKQRLLASVAAMAATPLVVHSESFGETHRLLGDLQNLVVAAGKSSSAQSSTRVLERRTKDAFAAIDKLAQSADCFEPGRVYIACEDPNFPGQIPESVHMQIIGVYGNAYLFFVAGTHLSAVAAAINAFAGGTGIWAVISVENQQRVELRSSLNGPDQFVTVIQYGDTQPMIRMQAIGGPSLFTWTDYGCAIGVPHCAMHGELYLSTGSVYLSHGLGPITLFFRGAMGSQAFVFASGTSQANFITAINSFETAVGVIATQSEMNPQRVLVQSLAVGGDAFIQVQQVGGLPPIIFETVSGGIGAYDVFDSGANGVPGDANCDRAVNLTDLTLVLNGWGPCPQLPAMCSGDVTGDGVVNVDDLMRVINNWGARE